MNRQTAILSAAVVMIVGLLQGSPATRAGVLWTAEFQADNPAIVSDSGNNALLLTPLPATDGQGNLTFLAAKLSVQSPFVGLSDSFTAQNYALNLVITDQGSHSSKSLLFSGSLTGTATPTSLEITNSFHSDHTSYEFEVDGNLYQVAIGPFELAGPQEANIWASVTARGEVVTGPPSPTVPTPEPSTFFLAVAGMACAGWAGWRKRRNR